MSGTDITSDEWRGAMGAFPAGVTVVTTWNGDKPVGGTVSSFCSVSLEPPLLLVCVDKNNPLNAPLLKSGKFGINFLATDAGDLAMRFAMEAEDKRFDGLGYHATGDGAPHLDGMPLFIDCVVEQSHRAGTHDVVIGRGLRIVNGNPQEPLAYHKGGFFGLSAL